MRSTSAPSDYGLYHRPYAGAALKDGLNAVRFAGKDGACVGCHAPDAYDLAKIGYSDEDIKRRALTHVDEQKAETIVAYVRALRQKHAMTELADAYLADPSDAKLWAYYDAIGSLTACAHDLSNQGDPAFYQRAGDWMRLKFKSLQVFQHMLRRATTAHRQLRLWPR